MRKKLLVSVLSAFMLSLCISSCSKDDDDEVKKVPVTEEEAEGDWTISGNPGISVTIPSPGDGEAGKIIDTLKFMFREGDKYKLNDDGSCIVTRDGHTAPKPKTYKIEGEYLIFEGYIKFLTDKSSDGKTLTLTAGATEIQSIVRKELEPKKEEFGEVFDIIIKAVKGEIKLVFKR
jgi:hypothetical protein